MNEHFDINMIDEFSDDYNNINEKSYKTEIIDINNILDTNQINTTNYKINNKINNNNKINEFNPLCDNCLKNMTHCSFCDGYFTFHSYHQHLKKCSEILKIELNQPNSNHKVCGYCKKLFESISAEDFKFHQNICSYTHLKISKDNNSKGNNIIDNNNKMDLNLPQEDYTCIFCDKKFDKTKEKQFLEHCSYCDYDKNDINNINNTLKCPKCPKCGIEYPKTNSIAYDSHFKNCSVELQVECIYCKTKLGYEKIEDHENKCIMNKNNQGIDSDLFTGNYGKHINPNNNVHFFDNDISNNLMNQNNINNLNNLNNKFNNKNKNLNIFNNLISKVYKGESSLDLLKEWDLYNTIHRKISSEVEDNCKKGFLNLIFEYDENVLKSGHFFNKGNKKTKVSAGSLKRISTEFKNFSTGLPSEFNSSFFVKADTENPQYIKFLIAGSRGTPYEHGLYLYDLFLPDDYPTTSPKCNLMTTGKGQIRFNPNLYNCGKVCLSLLGIIYN